MKVRRFFTLPWSGGSAGRGRRRGGRWYSQFSESVISDAEPEEVARRYHLAELEKMESYSRKGEVLKKH